MLNRVAAIAALVGLATISFATQVAAAAATPGAWAVTGNLTHARAFAPAVGLADGTVITAGGTDGASYLASAERWTGGTWAAAGSIGHAAAGQVAVRLPDGKALFAGGADALGYYGFGDIFDPTAGTWSKTTAMASAHAYGAAASLSNGDVLVIGGYDATGAVTGAVDIYSYSGKSWSAGTALPGGGRYLFTATKLADGRVLVAGGDDGTLSGNSGLATVQVYTSGSGWASAESMKKTRVDDAAVLLGDGRVLVAGGVDATGKALNTAETFDPATGHWTLTATMPTGRAGFTLSVLPDGRVIAAGGYSTSPSQALNTVDLFDPSTGGWSSTGPLRFGRRFQAAATMSDGSIMVVGGCSACDTAAMTAAEIYTPPPARLTYPATTFHPIAPVRILDSRANNGLNGVFFPRTPRRFQVTGRGPVPAGAVAVTGILTATAETAPGFLAIGPVFTANPDSSTLNFPAADSRANNVTVALDSTGGLSVVSGGSHGTTHALFDVTGYFTADDTGGTFKPMDPVRVLDSRDGSGPSGLTGKFTTKAARTFKVTGPASGPGATGVPDGALAVTGNLTVVKPSSAGWAFVGPAIADPNTLNSSTVNSPANDTRADGVTVQLASDGTLAAVWAGTAGSTADLVFDVTGYFVAGLTGSKFVPLEPIRLVDTRYTLPFAGPMPKAVPATVQVGGRAGVVASGVGITGNLTVTGQNAAGYLTVGPHLTLGVAPSYSTLNFPKGDNRANGFAVSLWSDGTIGIVYETSAGGASTQVILDLTGYFLPAP
jgi:hypothetical protein